MKANQLTAKAHQIQVKIGPDEWQDYRLPTTDRRFATQMLARLEAAELEFSPSDREEFRLITR